VQSQKSIYNTFLSLGRMRHKAKERNIFQKIFGTQTELNCWQLFWGINYSNSLAIHWKIIEVTDVISVEAGNIVYEKIVNANIVATVTLWNYWL